MVRFSCATSSAGGHAGHHTFIIQPDAAPPARRLALIPRPNRAEEGWGQIPELGEISPSRTRSTAPTNDTASHMSLVPYSPTVTRPPKPSAGQQSRRRKAVMCRSTGQARTTGGDGRVEGLPDGCREPPSSEGVDSRPNDAPISSTPQHARVGMPTDCNAWAHRRPRVPSRWASGPLRRRESLATTPATIARRARSVE